MTAWTASIVSSAGVGEVSPAVAEVVVAEGTAGASVGDGG
jgi:hypothetical protein